MKLAMIHYSEPDLDTEHMIPKCHLDKQSWRAVSNEGQGSKENNGFF